MTPDRFFFQVPIYDRPEEKHYGDQEAKKQERIACVAQGDKEAANVVAETHEAFDAFPWDYNRIFGFVGLYADRGAIKGDLYRRGHLFAATAFKEGSPARKKLLARKEIFDWGNVIELSFGADDSDEVIVRELLGALRRLPKQQAALKRRVLQLGTLERLGRFVSWRRLLDLER